MTQRVAYDRLAQGFGKGFNGPLLIAVALPDDKPAADAALQKLQAGAKTAPDVAAVAAPVVNRAGDAATITVIPRTSPQDPKTSALVNHLRDGVVPTATQGTGAQALGPLEVLPSELAFDPPRIVRVDRRTDVELWSRPGLLVLVIGLLGLEWLLRQRSGYL